MDRDHKMILTFNRPWFLFMVALETLSAGGLPTIIAIYPTVIIVVVALKSPQWGDGPSIRELVVDESPNVKTPLRRPSPTFDIRRVTDPGC
ncbi:hypothetical protein BD310DRAFT_927582 [Dichomitus squalens]|uniref:Uncharacterized protein n=1 Tax=Dichomitus squalens TaxID=114155 RepID=A0A4Q9PUT8_9APHY|nr:hypothetical protein BD310DRAFT_927582 [Dichomitus squalens]